MKGQKWATSEEDKEDFEQELRIKAWLEAEGREGEVALAHITCTGRAKNTLIKASMSLDQMVSDDTGTRFAELIAAPEISGSESESDHDINAEMIMTAYLNAMGFNEGDRKWVIRKLKLSIQENKSLFEKSASDLEW